MCSRSRKAKKLALRKDRLARVIQAVNLVGITVGQFVLKAAAMAGIYSHAKAARETERLRAAYERREYAGLHVPQWMVDFADAVRTAVSPRYFFLTVTPLSATDTSAAT